MPNLVRLENYIINLDQVAYINTEDSESLAVHFAAVDSSGGQMNLRLDAADSQELLDHLNLPVVQ